MVAFSDVAVVCSSRAEAGPLQSVIKELKGCSVCKVSYAYREDPHTAMGHALEAFSAAFHDINPKLVVVLGEAQVPHGHRGPAGARRRADLA